MTTPNAGFLTLVAMINRLRGRRAITYGVRSLVIVAFVLLAGCDSTAEFNGVRYHIPSGNLLSNTTAAEFVRLQYGRSEDAGELGLVFTGDEVAAAIPGYHATTQGYIGLVDDSPGALVRPDAPDSFDTALAENIARLAVKRPLPSYRGTEFGLAAGEGNSFALLNPQGEWARADMMPPLCRRNRTGQGGHYDSCTFSVRRNGFNFGFIMNGENVEFADEYVDFILSKLDEWRADPRPN